ncbi:Uncharacterised protein [Providencia stuartii]|nr:Uncharacterised protein [Providencia stuartii]
MDIIDQNRRKWLGAGAAAFGLSLLPSHVFAAMTTPKTKNFAFSKPQYWGIFKNRVF